MERVICIKDFTIDEIKVTAGNSYLIETKNTPTCWPMIFVDGEDYDMAIDDLNEYFVPLDEYVTEEFRSEIYATLSNLSMRFEELDESKVEELIDQSVEWWKTHFYEEN